jgi:hypothetical protein
MSQLSLEIQHGLDAGRAKQVADLALAHYLERFGARGLQANWVSESRLLVELAVRGVHLRGTVDVLPLKLQLSADVPLVLRPFKAMATAAIEREVQRWIAQVK